MAQVSKYQVGEPTEERISQLLVQAVSSCRGKRESTRFIHALLTPTEKVMLAKRISIAYLLMKKVDHRLISTVLSVSTGTINRISVLLKLDQGRGLKEVVQRIFGQEDLKQVFEEMVDGLFYGPFPPPGTDWRTWKKEKIRRQRRREDVFRRDFIKPS